MRKLLASWTEIIHDFGLPVLTVVFAYGIVCIVVNLQSPASQFLAGENARKMIALILWLTIIARTVRKEAVPVPVRQPLLELGYLLVWGLANTLMGLYLLQVINANPGWTLQVFATHYVVVFGKLALAVLFAVIFHYSASDLGIRLKHWRLYLAIIILTFPIGEHFLGLYSRLLVGIVGLAAVFILYRTNKPRWQGLAADLRSLHPYVLPILLCTLVTIGVAITRGNERILDIVTLPFRVFNTNTVLQGAMPEEFYYRLGLQTRLTSFMPFGWASLIQGIVFDASHIPSNLMAGWYLPDDIPWQFFTGISNALAAGYFWQRSRNLPATILFHMAVLI